MLIAACSAALVFSVKREERLETVTATTSPSQPAPSVRNEGSAALAATETKAAAPIAELAGQPGVLATDQSVPSFDVARIEGADAVIAGRAAPGAIVDLLRGGEPLDRAVADASGQFVMAPSHLPAGSYELTLNARLPDGTVTSSKQGVKVTVNDVGASSRAAQSRAEYIPESASQTRPPLQPHLRAAKPQESVALKSAHANPGSSANRRAAYGYGAGVVGVGVAAAAIGTAAAATSPWGSGYPGGYYGAYASDYPGYYGGVYANRSYVTGRPTLFPRYLAGNYGAYCYGGYPYGYYWSCPWGGYYGGGW
jgi:hypothetical protein